MANFGIPWNKGKGATQEAKKAKRKAYYQANKTKIKAAVKQRFISNHETNKEKARWSIIKHKYGITKQQWYAIHDQQKQCCKICQRHESEFQYKLVVDHCHKTGKIRGLLCNKCNLVMGTIDNPVLLEAALEYKRESQ